MKQLYFLTTKRCGIFLALLLLMALPMTAQTVGEKLPIINGLYYKVLNVANRTVAVTSDRDFGPIPDYQRKDYSAYNGTLSGSITIPSNVTDTKYRITWTVTEIGERAFQNEKITRVTFTNNITKIGSCAFLGTSSLPQINFPSSLTVIETSAFSESGLTGALTFPDNMFIGANAFQSCVKITSLDITKVNYLGSGCFRNCSGLSKVTVPLSAKIGQKRPTTLSGYKLTDSDNETSGDYAFADCYNLTEATIESGITTVPDHMFAFCGDLKTVTVPTSVTSIGGGAFRQCFSLDFIDMLEVNSIGVEAFWGCFNLKGDLVLSNKVKNLGNQAFGYTSLTGVKWEGAAGCTIGNNVFTGCHFLEYVDLHTLTNPTVANNRLNRHTGTAIDNLAGGLLSRTIVYLPQGVNFTFKDGEDVNFVKSDGTCTKLSVQDGADYEFPVGFTATTAVYNKWEVYMYDDQITIGDKKFKNRKTYTGVNYFCDEYDYDNNIAPLITYRDFSGIKAGKNCFTMLLPYKVTLPKGIRAYELHLKDNYNPPVQGEKEYTQYYLFRSIPDESVLEANKPYLLRITDGKEHKSDEFVAKSVTIATSSSIKVNDGGTEVTPTSSTSALRNVNAGTLKPQGYKAVEPNQEFFFVGGTERLNNHLAVNLHTWLLNTDKKKIDVWRPVKGGTATAAPFRGYIQPKDNTTGNAKRFVILMEDGTTGIDDLQQDKALNGAQRIYTLDGRYVGTSFDTLPNGIYVIKGKKIVK